MKSIKDIRHENNETQLEMAKRVGVTKAHVWHIETGKAGPSLKVLNRIAEVYGIDRSDIDCNARVSINLNGASKEQRQLAYSLAELFGDKTKGDYV